MLDDVRAGRAPVGDLFPYYLGWLGGSVAEHFTPPSDAETAPAREWGMRVAVGDLRHVVRAARRGGRKVVLGLTRSAVRSPPRTRAGTSGAGAGARELDGLVFIDGGSSRAALDAAQAREQLAALQTGSPFNDLVGLGLPWWCVFGAAGATLRSRRRTSARRSRTGRWRGGAEFRRRRVRDDAAEFGFAIDVDTGPANLALVQAHLGGLEPAGDDAGGATPAAAARHCGAWRARSPAFRVWTASPGTTRAGSRSTQARSPGAWRTRPSACSASGRRIA